MKPIRPGENIQLSEPPISGQEAGWLTYFQIQNCYNQQCHGQDDHELLICTHKHHSFHKTWNEWLHQISILYCHGAGVAMLQRKRPRIATRPSRNELISSIDALKAILRKTTSLCQFIISYIMLAVNKNMIGIIKFCKK